MTFQDSHSTGRRAGTVADTQPTIGTPDPNEHARSRMGVCGEDGRFAFLSFRPRSGPLLVDFVGS